MNLAEPQQHPSITVPMPRIYNLVGETLDGGWLVTEQLSSPLMETPAEKTGGNFSVCYRCERDGKEAFLKVFDVFRALLSEGGLAAVETVVAMFRHEAFLVDVCKEAALTRVVRGIDWKETKLDDPDPMLKQLPFCYVIFETADDGDLRDMLHRNSTLELALKFALLQQVAVGIEQLHKRKIAHQDLKPSNVGIFRSQQVEAKILDLGCAHSQERQSQRDIYPLPGDPSYAPPEQQYAHGQGGFNDRRASCDLFQLGSLLSFLVCGETAIAGIMGHVPFEFHPTNFGGNYDEVLPYIEEAFAKWLDDIEPTLPDWCREQVMQILRSACDPNPARRGDPGARLQQERPVGIDRFVSKFAMLAKRAEVEAHIKRVRIPAPESTA